MVDQLRPPPPPPVPPASPPHAPLDSWVWILPHVLCESEHATSGSPPYDSQADALAACQSYNCSGLANSTQLVDAHFPGVHGNDPHEDMCVVDADHPDGDAHYSWVGDSSTDLYYYIHPNRTTGADCIEFGVGLQFKDTINYFGGPPLLDGYAACVGCPLALADCTSPSTPPPASPPPPNAPPDPPPETPPSPLPPPFPPSPPFPPPFPPSPRELLDTIHHLPRHLCGGPPIDPNTGSPVKYPYATAAEAIDACLSYNCTGLANMSFINSTDYWFADGHGADTGNSTAEVDMCRAAWYINDVDLGGASQYVMGWYMHTADRIGQGCGPAGYNEWTQASAGAGCIGCPRHLDLCPSPPPDPPALPPKNPPTTPPSPPVHPIPPFIPPPAPPPFPPKPPSSPPSNPSGAPLSTGRPCPPLPPSPSPSPSPLVGSSNEYTFVLIAVVVVGFLMGVLFCFAALGYRRRGEEYGLSEEKRTTPRIGPKVSTSALPRLGPAVETPRLANVNAQSRVDSQRKRLQLVNSRNTRKLVYEKQSLLRSDV